MEIQIESELLSWTPELQGLAYSQEKVLKAEQCDWRLKNCAEL